MATQKVKPDPDGMEPQDRRRRETYRKAGAYALVAIVVAVVATAAFALWSSRTPNAVTARQPSASVQAVTAPKEPPDTETDPDAGWDGYGIPPEGTALSSPVEGQPILEQQYGGEWLLGRKIASCPTGCPEWYNTTLFVYADGRVLWWHHLRSSGGGGDFVMERRLTPEGVDLVRSGVEPGIEPAYGDLPDSAWASATARPYAPPRYAACFWANGVGDPSSHPLLAAVDELPAPARALLDGSDPVPFHPGCLVVSTKAARAFSEILSDVGLEEATSVSGGMTPGDTVGSWLLRDAEPLLGDPVGIYLRPLWPDGDWHEVCCA